MIYKKRRKPMELNILTSLRIRADLKPKEKQNLFNVEKGFEGEIQFDELMESVQCDHYLLNDLLLKYNDTVFQIDSLLITQEKIYLYEIKNYQGEFHFDNDSFFKVPQQELIHPLHQLGRTTSLFKQLLLKNGFKLTVSSHVVFVNPMFTLFQAPMNSSLILPTQISNHIEHLNKAPSTLTPIHKKLAERLSELHLEESPYQLRPEYVSDQMKNGLFCSACHSFQVTINGKSTKSICQECGFNESVEDTVLRLVDELKMLFPEIKITTRLVEEWSGQSLSKKVIRNILNMNFTKQSSNRWIFYTEKRED